jgi:hypothetical protein
MSQPLSCPAGRYGDTINAFECHRCAAGTYQSLTGQNDISACLSCPMGSYSSLNGSITCQGCEAGYYNDRINQTSCYQCGANRYSPTSNAIECLICQLPGVVIDNHRLCDIKTCDKGQEVDTSTANGTCIPCSIGYWSNEKAATCLPCQRGSYNAMNGSDHCWPCSKEGSKLPTPFPPFVLPYHIISHITYDIYMMHRYEV